MTASHNDGPQLQCPHCGYALRGLMSDHHDVMRCPECGGLTTIMAIVDEHARKRRGDRRLLIALMAGLAFIGLLAIGPSMFPPLYLHEFGWFELVVLTASFVACCLYTQRRYKVSHTVALVFSMITAVLTTAMVHNFGSSRFGQPLAVLLLAMWLLGFHWWAVHRRA